MKKILFALIILALAVSFIAGWGGAAMPVLAAQAKYVTATPARAVNFRPTRAATLSALWLLYYGGSGGPGDEGECVSSPPVDSATFELMDSYDLAVCWPVDEPVTLWAYRPDGVQYETTVLKPKNGEVMIHYQPQYDYPAGKYYLFLTGANREFRVDVLYSEPKQARIREVSTSPFVPVGSTGGPRRNLLLQHFVPGEKVQLFVMDDKQIVGWQDLVIPESGNLRVNANLENVSADTNLMFQADGQWSGSVTYGNLNGDRYAWVRVRLCEGSSPSRMRADTAWAQVSAGNEQGVTVYQSPGLNSLTLRSIPVGTLIYVKDPVCADQAWFWMAHDVTYNRIGWVAEAVNGLYQIEPAPAPTAVPTPTPPG